MGILTEPRAADHTYCWIENDVIACQFIFYKSCSLKNFIIAYPEQEIDIYLISTFLHCNLTILFLAPCSIVTLK